MNISFAYFNTLLMNTSIGVLENRYIEPNIVTDTMLVLPTEQDVGYISMANPILFSADGNTLLYSVIPTPIEYYYHYDIEELIDVIDIHVDPLEHNNENEFLWLSPLIRVNTWVMGLLDIYVKGLILCIFFLLLIEFKNYLDN